MIYVKFKALKAGKSSFEFGGNLMYTFDKEITVKEKDCPLCSNETKKDNQDVLLYVSLGLTAVLLISNIVILSRTRKNKINK